MNTPDFAVIVAGCALSIGSLSGCVRHHASEITIESMQQLQAAPELDLVSVSNEVEAGMWEMVLAELQLQALNSTTPQSSPEPEVLPQLVAGDWLAFECAIAGGYWDSGFNKGTPVFAEVPESWLIPE